MAATTMHRSAYGLASLGEDWRRDAVCTPTLHTDYPRSLSGYDNHPAAEARHICRQHCPVASACSRHTRREQDAGRTPAGVVQAGLVWLDVPKVGPVKMQPADPGCGPWCRELRGIPTIPTPAPATPGTEPHGTTRRYRQGCRCFQCRGANTGRHRELRAKARAEA